MQEAEKAELKYQEVDYLGDESVRLNAKIKTMQTAEKSRLAFYKNQSNKVKNQRAEINRLIKENKRLVDSLLLKDSDNEGELRNGDIATVNKHEYFVIGLDAFGSVVCQRMKGANSGNLASFHSKDLSKPQTAEQKAAIEREEKLELYCKFVSDSLIDELAQMLIDLGAEIK
jgi:hypothetical protein